MTLNRRQVLGAGISSAAVLATPMVMAKGKPRVVVVGGGAGGATAARYIAKDSNGDIDVVLIDQSRSYYTCFFSNLYMGGLLDLNAVEFNYGTLASEYGINVLAEWVDHVDRETKTISMGRTGPMKYDRLILSPGIDFIEGSVPGWDASVQDLMPHAYKAGTQTQLLRSQILNMKQGGTFAMLAPPDPYRCPPGPYERISMVAHVLSRTNPSAKILIIDPKEKFSKQALFEEGWQKYYGGMIERIGPDFGAKNVSVDPYTMTIDIDGSFEKVDVCNVIPAQKAGRICERAGVTKDNWAPVVPHTMQSRMDEHVYVLGDATSQGDMPKSAFSANSQAKVAAQSILGSLLGKKVFPAKFENTCWSIIEEDDAVKVGASYEATDDKIARVAGFISQLDESPEVRKANVDEAKAWYGGITKDIFGYTNDPG